MPRLTSDPILDPRLKLASELYHGGRLGEALAHAESLWSDGPPTAALTVLLGELRLLANRLDAAAPLLRAALDERPGHPRLTGLWAELERRRGHWRSAAAALVSLGRTACAAQLDALARTGAGRLPPGWSAPRIAWIERDPVPMIEVRVGDRIAHMLLDTGIGDTLLDRDLAHRLDLQSFGGEAIHFPAGPPGRVEYAILPRLGLGPLDLEGVPVQVMPLRETFAGLIERPVDGILGLGLLSRFHSRLDGHDGRLCLTRPERPGPGVPFYWAGEHYALVEARIDDRLDTLLFLDTGMVGAAFRITPAMAEHAGLESGATRTHAGFAIAHQLAARPVRAQAIEAAGARRERLDGMLVAAFRLERAFGFRVSGLLGQDFIAGGSLDLDLAHMRVSLTAPSH